MTKITKIDQVDGTSGKGEWLPATPGVYGRDCGGYRHRWMPGAFGDRETLEDVDRFKVIRDEWVENEDGSIFRTILEGEVVGDR